jgi:C1A family cysteine protease
MPLDMTINENKEYVEGIKFGWKPDNEDHRDYFRVVGIIEEELPKEVDRTTECPEIYDQRSLGSCTANAINGLFQFNLIKHGFESFIPSRLFLYFNERRDEGCIAEDSGAMIRTGMKSINKDGVCHETTWPYVESKFKNKPTIKAYIEAKGHQSISYSRVPQTLIDMKSCLAEGFPFVFGFQVFNSMMTKQVATTGKVPMPDPQDVPQGGHAVMAVGYSDSKGCFIVRNSWGYNWGIGGYFYLPYEYLTNKELSSDFWTIKLVEG